MISIGVVAPPDLPPADFIHYAQDAERLGFDQLWVVEDCFFRGGIAQAAVALAQTRSLTVGCGILPAGARNPAFAALDIGTLAAMFPGRLVVGAGHGMPNWMRQTGSWPESPVTLLTEYITALKDLLAGRKVTTDGRYVRLSDVQLESPPVSAPPVLAGVRGPVSLRRTGAVADGVILAEPVTPEYLGAVRRITDPARVVAYNIGAIDESPALARQRARQGLRMIGDPEWAPHIAPLPFAEEFAELRQEAASREAFADALPDAWVDQLAVVGTARTAAERAHSLAAAGATDLVLIPAGDEPRACLPSLARILPEIAHLRNEDPDTP
ncbi:LLM class flavin-dependent oxidoreductase [Streptomyces sp. NPDC026672]|uniref:LLM class flavin-dependent oxidoreductase n=1 Tax=unclassified Streptomyces TaxID=2593676 RepID=UPI0033D948C2